MTLDEIEAGKTEKGGFTKATLATWGVPYPPPKGWKEMLVRGGSFDVEPKEIINPSPIRPNVEAHDLLRQVVVAVVNQGHASDLYEFPDILAYFGAKYPAESMRHDTGWQAVPEGMHMP